MKIKSEDFKVLQDAMQETINKHPNAKGVYKGQGLTKTRYAWDMLHYTEIDGYNSSTQFICDRLYKYLNDTHINTALFKIIGEY